MEMKWFIKARHWQVFLVVFILPLTLLMSGFVLTKYYYDPGILFSVFPLSIVFAQATLYLWMWIVVSRLSSKIPQKKMLKLGTFRLFIVIPIIVTGLTLVFFLYCATLFNLGSFSIAAILYGSLIVIIPMQLLIIISLFYCCLFVAKTIVMVEKGRDVLFEDYFYEFVMVILFPIGIWFLQPRINKIAND